jgi:hypothetical protein
VRRALRVRGPRSGRSQPTPTEVETVGAQGLRVLPLDRTENGLTAPDSFLLGSGADQG